MYHKKTQKHQKHYTAVRRLGVLFKLSQNLASRNLAAILCSKPTLIYRLLRNLCQGEMPTTTTISHILMQTYRPSFS